MPDVGTCSDLLKSYCAQYVPSSKNEILDLQMAAWEKEKPLRHEYHHKTLLTLQRNLLRGPTVLMLRPPVVLNRPTCPSSFLYVTTLFSFSSWIPIFLVGLWVSQWFWKRRNSIALSERRFPTYVPLPLPDPLHHKSLSCRPLCSSGAKVHEPNGHMCECCTEGRSCTFECPTQLSKSSRIFIIWLVFIIYRYTLTLLNTTTSY